VASIVNAVGEDVPVYVTETPEKAANLLAKNYDRVLVRMVYSMQPYIRFRPKMLNDKAYVVRHNIGDPSGFERGVCLWYRAIEGNGPPPIPINAMLFAECPRSMKELKSLAANVSHEIVIYQPPTWEAHTATITRRSSPAKLHNNLICLRDFIKFVEEARPIHSVPRLLHAHHGR
jgi:hypothetical protein